MGLWGRKLGAGRRGAQAVETLARRPPVVAAPTHLAGLGDVLLGGRRVPGVGGHVAHLGLRLDGDHADGDAPQARAAGDDGARPAGLRLDPRAAVEQAGLPADLAGAAVAACIGLRRRDRRSEASDAWPGGGGGGRGGSHGEAKARAGPRAQRAPPRTGDGGAGVELLVRRGRVADRALGRVAAREARRLVADARGRERQPAQDGLGGAGGWRAWHGRVRRGGGASSWRPASKAKERGLSARHGPARPTLTPSRSSETTWWLTPLTPITRGPPSCMWLVYTWRPSTWGVGGRAEGEGRAGSVGGGEGGGRGSRSRRRAGAGA
jgi:hypothetical protein